MVDLPPGVDPSAIVTSPSEQFCADHLRTLAEWEIPTLNATLEAITVVTGTRAFYAIAYREKNGYDLPDGLDPSDVPDSEAPEMAHLNAALEVASPICCFIEEHAENPWPDEGAPPLIAILAHSAQETREE